MKLRSKTMFSISIAVAALIIGLYGVSQFLLIKGFSRLEIREANQNIERVKNILDQEISFVAAKVTDWAAWDDAYSFVKGENEAFKDANLIPETGANVKADYMLYFDLEGKRVGTVAYNLDAAKERPLAPYIDSLLSTKSYFLNHKGNDEIKRGIILTPDGIALTVSHPVTTGAKDKPKAGTLVMMRFLTPSLVKSIAEVSKFEISKKEIASINNESLKVSSSLDKVSKEVEWQALSLIDKNKGSVIIEKGDNALEGYVTFKDVVGNNVMAFKIGFKRDVMREGVKSINSLVLSIAIFGLFFGAGLILLIEKSVVSRVVRLNRRVDEIGKSSEKSRVEVEGKDEISFLSCSINSMLDSIDEKTKAVKIIMDNVDFGLLRCGVDGNILKGFSKSCPKLVQQKNIEGVKIWDILNMGERDKENFKILYEQVTSDSLLAEDLITQLPSRFDQSSGDTISLFGSVILDDSGEVESVLFSLANISALAKAEKENTLNKALLKILQSKERFSDLVSRVVNDSKEDKNLNALLANDNNKASLLSAVKRNLHTWKGDFSAFGLKEVASEIHEIEENVSNTSALSSGINALCANIIKFLETHKDILGVDVDASEKDQNISLYKAELLGLEKQLDACHNVEEARFAIKSFIKTSSYSEASKIFKIAMDSLPDVAKKLNKLVKVSLIGGDVKLPPQYNEVYNSLIHVFRNAIDHGLEYPHERMGKSLAGNIEIKISKDDRNYIIEISDDGKGVNLEAVRKKSLEKNLLSQEQWEALRDGEKLLMIFKEGFSTKESVTELSGRGVGLDAVKTSIDEAQGSLYIESKNFEGTKIKITLPRIY